MKRPTIGDSSPAAAGSAERDTFAEGAAPVHVRAPKVTAEEMAQELMSRFAVEASKPGPRYDRRVMLYLPTTLYDELKRFCEGRGLTLSGVARVLVEDMLHRIG